MREKVVAGKRGPSQAPPRSPGEAESGAIVRGFVIARIMNAPPVYDPGGKTALVDDFCVEKKGPRFDARLRGRRRLERLKMKKILVPLCVLAAVGS